MATVRSRFRALIDRVVALLAGERVELPLALVERWPELRRARYRRGGMPPRIGGWCLGARTVSGITLWRTIWLAGDASWEPALLLHELRHVEQFEATRGFPIRYVWESMRHGYRANRFEVDARAFAARRLQEAAAPSLSEDV